MASDVRVVRLTLDYPPSGNHYKKYYCLKSSPANPHPVRASLTAEATAYKKTVATLAQQNGITPLSGPVRLIATFYRPRAVGDADNLMKVLQDSLQGVAYDNDNQIRELHVYVKDDDKHNARAEVRVERIT